MSTATHGSAKRTADALVKEAIIKRKSDDNVVCCVIDLRGTSGGVAPAEGGSSSSPATDANGGSASSKPRMTIRKVGR